MARAFDVIVDALFERATCPPNEYPALHIASVIMEALQREGFSIISADRPIVFTTIYNEPTRCEVGGAEHIVCVPEREAA